VILGVNGIRLVGKRSGVARAIEAVLNCLAEMDQPFDDIRVYSPAPIDPAVRLPAIARNVVVPSPLPPGLWEQITLPAAHGKKNVLFCPSYVMPLLAQCPTLLAHHGSYEGYKGASEVFSRWTRLKARVMYDLSAHRASIVTTVSQYSKQDMVYYYRLHPQRIHVVPEGVDTRLFRPLHDRAALAAWRRRHLGGDTPFLLYVGKPTKRRNLPNLLAAFRRLKREHGLPHKLVMIGSALPGTSFVQDIRALGLEDEIVDVPYAAHEDIALAYNACAAMIYPSAYEGFGMPVLEAMACGAPVITLDNTAFPEFAGGVAMLLPDAEVETLVRAIWELLNDSQRRQCMAEAGPRRAAAYDWRIVTAQYLELLERLIGCSERNV
jgi:glycosyltransferase involved in cell wall biosynthesis